MLGIRKPLFYNNSLFDDGKALLLIRLESQSQSPVTSSFSSMLCDELFSTSYGECLIDNR